MEEKELKTIKKGRQVGISEVEVNELAENIAKSEAMTKKEEKLEQKRKEKAEKKQQDYIRGMISRGEAVQLATGIARQEISQSYEFIREPMRGNILQTMALYRLLLDKGIIENEEEFNKYLAVAQASVEAAIEEEESAADEAKGIDESSEYPEEVLAEEESN